LRGGIYIKRFLYLILVTVSAIIILPAIILFMFSFGNENITKPGYEIKVLSNGEVHNFQLEEYLFGVVAAEMPAAFHPEALKAQAVAARTYIINKKLYGDNDHKNADVCTDSTHCNAYLSKEDISKKYGADWIESYSAKIKKAVSDTENMVAVYGGEPIEAVFHSTGSGMTENAKDVWGGDVPYLVSVESPGDKESPVFLNNIEIDYNEIKKRVFDKYEKDISVYVGEISRNESGSVNSVDIGGINMSGVEAREIFSLPSANFTVTANEKGLVFKCKGKGHGVGMSQYGAEYFAKQGMNYIDILKTYYKGIEVVSFGETNDKDFQGRPQ